MTLSEKLSLIQVEFKAKKSRYNSFGKYNFRSAEDILEALKPFNEKYKVYFLVNEQVEEVAGKIVLISTAIIKDTESEKSTSMYATAIVGVDFNQKGMNTPQQFGSASSYAKKYALGNLLLIDDTQDADATNKHGKDTKPKLRKGSDAWIKAVKYIEGGGKVNAIQVKYDILADDLKSLEALQK